MGVKAGRNKTILRQNEELKRGSGERKRWKERERETAEKGNERVRAGVEERGNKGGSVWGTGDGVAI